MTGEPAESTPEVLTAKKKSESQWEELMKETDVPKGIQNHDNCVV